MRRVCHFLLTALAAFVPLVPQASAQLIPWTEPPAMSAPGIAHPNGSSHESHCRASRPKKKLVGRIDAKFSSAVIDDAAVMHALSEPVSSSLLLSSFGASVGSGWVLSTSSWVGNVTQNAASITVGGTARDDNGWGASGLSLDATGMNFISITAQRDAGNQATSIFLQFEDRNLRTQVFSVSTSQFAIGVPTTVHVPIGAWTINFGSSDIASWSIGGGGTGIGDTAVPFRLTIDELSFTASAIPEPATYAAILGIAALLGAVWRCMGRGEGCGRHGPSS